MALEIVQSATQEEFIVDKIEIKIEQKNTSTIYDINSTTKVPLQNLVFSSQEGL